MKQHGRAANGFLLNMFWQHSQYDSRLGFWLGLGLGLELLLGLWLGLWLLLGLRVIFRVRVRARVDFRVRVIVSVRVNLTLTLTLTNTLKLNPNLLSYWECCQNMIRRKKIAAGPSSLINFRSPESVVFDERLSL